MGIKGVLNNIQSKGLRETHRIRLCRKYDLVTKAELKTVIRKLKKSRSDVARYKNIAFDNKIKSAAYNKLSAAYNKLSAAYIMRQLFQELNGNNDEVIAEIDAIIEEMLNATTHEMTKEALIEWDKKMLALERGDYKKALKRMFVKELIPENYDKKAEDELDSKKIVFLQPRRGLNQAFRYIYRKMEKEGEYIPVLFELHRGEVSTAEHYLNALGFIREAATSKAIMVHESSDYLSYVNIREDTKVIQLWHGCGVIKHLGLDNAGKPGFKTLKDYIEFPEYNKYDLVTIASEGQREVFERFMGKETGDPVIQALGVSRTDEFFEPEYVNNCYAKLYDLIPDAKEKKIILYAPTYRGKDPNRTAPDQLDVARFAERLSDDYVLLIKHHQTAKEIPEIPEEYRGNFAHDVTRGFGMDINELMTVADICISDYSSVVFEYSLFERPILFYMYDLEEYSDNRGMYYSYEELADCGPIFKTNEEMIEYIEHIEDRFDRSKVTGFKDRFMSACDGHASDRIISFIES